MKVCLSDSDDLYRATTLSERAARLEANAPLPSPDGDIARARARLERWQQPPTFADASSFALRLQAEGLTEPQLLSLLAEPAHALSRRFDAPPDWMEEIAAAYGDLDTQSGAGGTPDAETAQLGLLRLAFPLIARARQRLQTAIRETCRAESSLPFDPETVDRLFLPALVTPLGPIVMRILTLELNVARLQGQLTGETAEERYQSFVERLGQTEYAIGLLKEYPVMARQIAATAQRWTERTTEFLQRLCADWPVLRDAFAPGIDPGRMIEIESGGDAHRGGRSVLIARFESGLHLVYKPRALAVDVHFQDLLAWLNERGAAPAFRTLTVLDRGEYGWVEYVVGEPCSDEAGMRRFYERQGGYLALLYALEATDFHFENLIAAGEDPVLLDLEALFHPRLWESGGTEASEIAWNALGNSVLRIGLLPQRMPGSGKANAVDISGLGGGADQMTPYALPRWEAMGTDTMHLVRKPVPIPAGKHQPLLNGAAGRASEHTDAIQSGFTQMYRLLWRLRAELLAEGGPLDQFAEDPVRVLLRNTQQYAMLLNESFHPDVCRDALDRDRLLDRLWRDVPVRPGLERVLPSELRDLNQGDIPMFTGRPGVRHLWDSRDAQIRDFCADSGLDLVRRRLQGFSEEDLARQVWIIQSSLLTLTEEPRDRTRSAGAAVPEGSYPTPARREDLLELASAVGDRLVALALRGEQDATWIGVSLQGDSHGAFAPASLDLYDGLPGIILFLAHLGATTGVERYTSTARAALNTVRSQIARSGEALDSIGLFTGLGGLIYLFTHLSAIWEQPEMLQEAEALLPQLSARIDADAQFDVIAGAAGCLASLLGLADVSGSRQAMFLARHCGDHLVRHACPQHTGVGWISMADNAPLTGFSHGGAGVAHVLLDLWSRTGDERYRATACAGLAYERSLFSTEASNWVDLRQLETDVNRGQESAPHCVTAWCHGAPGIGLSRLYARRHLQDPCLLQEIETAVKTTLTSGFGIGHSLCHGDLGNIELVRTALEQMPAHFGGLSLEAPLIGIVESIRRNGWLCGNPRHIESPGLMTGIAGIGYGLLRLAAPETVPSVLALEAPYAR